MFNLFRHCRKYEISFDIVAKTGDIVVGVDGTIGDIVADFGDNVAVFGDIVAGVDGALLDDESDEDDVADKSRSRPPC